MIVVMIAMMMMMIITITVSDRNHHQNQSLIPLSDFSLHIHSPPFTVSVHTLQSPTYTSSSPFPVPSCYCPADGCAATVGVWFHSGKVEMLVRVVRNVLFLWLKETRDMWHSEPIFAGRRDCHGKTGTSGIQI